MKKLLASVAVFAAVVVGVSIAQADVFDPDTGTVTVMASGGTVYEDHTVTAQTISSNTVVAAATVPAGRYVINAKAWVDQSLSAETFVQCGLLTGFQDRTRLAAGSGYLPVVASVTVEYTEETEIEFYCTTDNTIDVYNTVLTATTVSAVVPA